MAERRISEHWNKLIRNFSKWNAKKKRKKENNKKKKQNRTEHPRTVTNIRRYNIYITGIVEGEERENGMEEIIEVIMVENIWKLMTDTKWQIQIQETQRDHQVE